MTVPMMIPILSMMGVYRVLVVDKNRGVDRPQLVLLVCDKERIEEIV